MSLSTALDAGADATHERAREAMMDAWLAALLRGEAPLWPDDASRVDDAEALADRAIYHGLAGLLVDALDVWPSAPAARLKAHALAQAMWEIRHRLLVVRLLQELDVRGVEPILLKGTALAYDLYEYPAVRSRGDTDMLITRAELAVTREVLAALGFERASHGEALVGDMHRQEIWTHAASENGRHDIDLHWQVMNSPFLEPLFPHAECAAGALALPRLCAPARSMARVPMLLHLCLHRAVHVSNPYYVDGVPYFGGDRLIWAEDLHRVAQVLSPADWVEFAEAAEAKSVAAICHDALAFAQRMRGTVIPAPIAHRLARADESSAVAQYLFRSGQMARAWRDLRATRGLGGKLRFVLAQALPSRGFMADNYPQWQGRPLALQYGQRLVGIAARRLR